MNRGFKYKEKQDIISQRNSNNELLRIICMFFIIIHHFLVHAVFPETLNSEAPLNLGIVISTFTNGFIYLGVNCFILLSGYYSVKLRWKNIFQLYIVCATYGLIGYLFHLWYDGASVGRSIIYNSILIFSHSSWWYITCYLVLLLISPLLNSGINKMSQHQHLITIIALSISQVYFGYYQRHGMSMSDSSGYNVMQFFYMYLIGAYIQKYVQILKNKRMYYLLAYIVCSMLWGVLSCMNHIFDMSRWWRPFAYNNPIVIIASIAFFLFFQTFSFTNKTINWLATGTLAAYLVQDQYYLGSVIYKFISKLTINMPYFKSYLLVIIVSFIFLLCMIVIDKGRARLTKPFIDFAKRMDERYPLN